jgi:hypothetical protein
MGNANTVTVQLTVKDDGSVVMKQFGKNTEEAMGKASASTKNTSSALKSLKDSYVDMAAKAATAYMAVAKAMEYMDKGAKAQQAEDSFRSLTDASNESANAIIANMKRATNSTIDDSLMMQKYVKASLLDLSSAQTTQIAEMARMAARTTGENVSTAFDSIVNAISTNMPKALKQYGLITKEQQSLVSQAMAEGVEDVDLFSIAWENYNKQLEKTGPLYENDAERLQQYKAKIEDTQESFGKLLLVVEGFTLDKISNVTGMFASAAASIASGNLSPFTQWQMDVSSEGPALKEAQAELERYQAKFAAAQKSSPGTESAAALLKASQQAMAQKKTELETMKALDKTYFADQEGHINAALDLMMAAGGDEYAITKDTFARREELMAEYYNRTQQEILLEAEVRSKADRDKLDDAHYIAEKTKALEAEVAARGSQLIREKSMFAIQTAQNDIKNLTSRLGEYQTYYDSLKAKMDKNIEDEKKHLEELKALRQQSVDIDKSTAALIAGIKGTDASISAQQRYESARTDLSYQYGSAMNLGGQDQIQALENYKQAVASLQSQFAQGIPGGKDIFGSSNDIVSAKQIAEDAISDIERATLNQKNALALLTAEKENQIEADRQWGQVLQESAQAAQAEMERLNNMIADISTQIMNMQTNITLTGEDRVSDVVDGIISKIEYMHALASQSVNIGGSAGYSVMSSSSSMSGSDGFTDIPFTDIPFVLDSYADGTDYVPKTGRYQLHEGEAVLTAQENKSGRSVNINGDIIINVPASASTKSGDDWRMITRQYIVPELKKLQ